MNRDLDYILIPEDKLKARIKEIAKQLEVEYAGRIPTILCVMKGSLVFTADLIREMDIPMTIESISLSSYRDLATRPGEITMAAPLSFPVEGKDLIVIEDILDTGRTLSFAMKLLKARNPASMKLVVLLDKPSRREAAVEADIVGFSVPDAFVVGYGLDYNQLYRNLPCIGVLKPSVYGG